MERDCTLLGLLILSSFLYFLNVIFGILSYTLEGIGIQITLLIIIIFRLSLNKSEINWVFPFWNGVIWIWMSLSFSYLILNIFRENKDGKMYCNPRLVTTEVCALLSLTSVLHLLFLFIWDMESFVGSAVILFFLSATTWASLVIFSFRLWKATPFLTHHTNWDLWIYRILIQNGFGMYASWVSLEFIMKLGLALTSLYDDEEHDDWPTPSAVSIIFLNLIIAITFPLELLSWEKSVRYLFTPYFVCLWVVISIYVRIAGVYHDQTVQIYSLIMVVILVIFFLGRNGYMLFRHFKRPLVPYV